MVTREGICLNSSCYHHCALDRSLTFSEPSASLERAKGWEVEVIWRPRATHPAQIEMWFSISGGLPTRQFSDTVGMDTPS